MKCDAIKHLAIFSYISMLFALAFLPFLSCRNSKTKPVRVENTNLYNSTQINEHILEDAVKILKRLFRTNDLSGIDIEYYFNSPSGMGTVGDIVSVVKVEINTYNRIMSTSDAIVLKKYDAYSCKQGNAISHLSMERRILTYLPMSMLDEYYVIRELPLRCIFINNIDTESNEWSEYLPNMVNSYAIIDDRNEDERVLYLWIHQYLKIY